MWKFYVIRMQKYNELKLGCVEEFGEVCQKNFSML